MPAYAEAKNAEEKVAELKSELKPEQARLAEWLATPAIERTPKSLKALSGELKVSDRSVKAWKKIPAVIQLVNTLNAQRLIDLVPEAIKVIDGAIKHPGSISRVSYDAAKDVVKDWGKAHQVQDDVMKSLQDIWKKYN